MSPAGGYWAVQAKDIDESNDHVLNLRSLERIDSPRDLSSYTIQNGDVLFLARGRRRSATLVEGLPALPPAIALYYFFIVRIKVAYLHPAFLVWVINEVEAQSYLERVSSSTGMPFVTKQLFGALELEVPSLERQSEIVRLYRLSRRESMLLRSLEEKRSQLARSVCRRLCREVE